MQGYSVREVVAFVEPVTRLPVLLRLIGAARGLQLKLDNIISTQWEWQKRQARKEPGNVLGRRIARLRKRQ